MKESLDAKHEKLQDHLQSLSGNEFDKAYTQAMLKAHKQDIAKYQQAVQQLEENDLKQYAQTCLPTLREQLQHAKLAAVGVDQATISSILNKSPNGLGNSHEEQLKQTGRGSGTSNSGAPQSQTHVLEGTTQNP